MHWITASDPGFLLPYQNGQSFFRFVRPLLTTWLSHKKIIGDYSVCNKVSLYTCYPIVNLHVSMAA